MKVKIEVTDEKGKVHFAEVELEQLKGKPTKIRAAPPSPAKKPLSLPERILLLRDKGFFKQPKVYPEVHAEIQKTYYCDPDRVGVALIRLHERKQLRKTAREYEGERMVAYVW